MRCSETGGVGVVGVAPHSSTGNVQHVIQILTLFLQLSNEDLVAEFSSNRHW